MDKRVGTLFARVAGASFEKPVVLRKPLFKVARHSCIQIRVSSLDDVHVTVIHMSATITLYLHCCSGNVDGVCSFVMRRVQWTRAYRAHSTRLMLGCGRVSGRFG
jgi:hypothetical protein